MVCTWLIEGRRESGEKAGSDGSGAATAGGPRPAPTASNTRPSSSSSKAEHAKPETGLKRKMVISGSLFKVSDLLDKLQRVWSF